MSREDRNAFHRDQAEQALLAARHMLERFGVPYHVHMELGQKAYITTDAARRLRCDQIVMSAAQKNSLTRLVECPITNKAIELTSVPLEIIAGGRGIPLNGNFLLSEAAEGENK